MSSHRVSGSGDRHYTLQAGGGSFTAFQIPSKYTDAATLTVGAAGGIEMMLPAQGVKLERYEDPETGSVYQYLTIDAIDGVWTDREGKKHASPGEVALSAVIRPVVLANGEPGTRMLHTNVDVRRYDPEAHVVQKTYARKELCLKEQVDLSIPPTEPEEAKGPGFVKAERGSR